MAPVVGPLADGERVGWTLVEGTGDEMTRTGVVVVTTDTVLMMVRVTYDTASRVIGSALGSVVPTAVVRISVWILRF